MKTLEIIIFASLTPQIFLKNHDVIAKFDQQIHFSKQK